MLKRTIKTPAQIKARQVITFIVALVLILAFSTTVAYAAGDVSGAIESTWSAAKSQIKSVVNNVVFPVVDCILAILFFVKVGTAYFDCAPVKVI